MRRRGAGGARTKRYTDELGEYWVKQFKQFSQKNADPNSSISAYTSHSSGFRDANVELPPPPIDAAPPTTGVSESRPTEISLDEGQIKTRVAQHQHRHYSGRDSSCSSSLLRNACLEQQDRQAKTSGSNASGHADAVHCSVAAPGCKGQMFAPSGTESVSFQPEPQSNLRNPPKAEAAKPLQLLGGALVPIPTEMRPTELFIFPRGPHSMRTALTTNATATHAVQLGPKN